MRSIAAFVLVLLLAIPALASDCTVFLTGTATATSTLIVSANGFASYFIIVNEGPAEFRVKPKVVQTGYEGLPIPSGGSYETSGGTSQNAWYFRTSAGTSGYTVLQCRDKQP